MNQGLKILYGLLYKGLYFIALFFIYIGEQTQKPFSSIFLFLRKKLEPAKSPVFHENKKSLLSFKIVLPKLIFPKVNFAFITTRIRYFGLGVFVTLGFILVFESYSFVVNLPSPTKIGKVNYPVSSLIYDRNGKLLYEIYKSQNRTPVILSQLPTYVVNSTIAIEDKDFYNHNGVALFSGILRAIRETLITKSLQGGSTITQQLVKSALLTPERTINRKIKEIILALWTERIYDKDKILEMYLNQVPYGGSSYGIQEASKTYFGHDAKDLTLEEAALLAGLPQAPSLYSPYNNPEAALHRRNKVLQAMEIQGYIDHETRIESEKKPINVLPPKTAIKAPHFVFYVKNQLEDSYGISMVEEGGLRVTTTLDLDIQNEVEKIVREELSKIEYLNVSNAAVLVTRPTTGEILAMVGSKDYFEDEGGAFNVTTALRQPGSSIKPIMYALAIQKGYTAATIIDDSPVRFPISQSEVYSPVNYDGRFHGKVTLRMALSNSYNIPAVRMLEKVGLPDFIDFAEKMGISTWVDRSRFGLSLVLGGGEVTMIDMATSYGTLANNGYKIKPSYYLKIEGSHEKDKKEFHPFKIKEIDSGIAYIISDILSDNITRRAAFGSGSALEIPGYKVAVKTGTTDSKKDNWTIGYTPDFLVTVWVGNNDNTPMNPYLSSGVTGAAPIWNRVMSYLLKNFSGGGKWYEMPEDITSKNCYFGRKEYFIKGTETGVNCGEKLGPVETPTPTSNP